MSEAEIDTGAVSAQPHSIARCLMRALRLDNICRVPSVFAYSHVDVFFPLSLLTASGDEEVPDVRPQRRS